MLQSRESRAAGATHRSVDYGSSDSGGVISAVLEIQSTALRIPLSKALFKPIIVPVVIYPKF